MKYQKQVVLKEACDNEYGAEDIFIADDMIYLLKEASQKTFLVERAPRSFLHRIIGGIWKKRQKYSDEKLPKKEIAMKSIDDRILGKDARILEVANCYASDMAPFRSGFLIRTDRGNVHHVYSGGVSLLAAPENCMIEDMGFGGGNFYMCGSKKDNLFEEYFMVFDSQLESQVIRRRVYDTSVSSLRFFFANFGTKWEVWDRGKVVKRLRPIPYEAECWLDAEEYFTDGKSLYQTMEGGVWLLTTGKPMRVGGIDSNTPVMATDGRYAAIAGERKIQLIKGGEIITSCDLEDDRFMSMCFCRDSIYLVGHEKMYRYRCDG